MRRLPGTHDVVRGRTDRAGSVQSAIDFGKVTGRRLRAMTPSARRTRLIALAAGLIAVAAIAVPVFGGAASPVPAADPIAAAESEKPGNGPPAEKPGKGPKAEKVASAPVTLTGLVGSRTDADGRTVYTLTVGSTVYDLHAGPPWWWGDSHPLAAYVGDTVTVTGEKPENANEVDVLTVDGKTIREPGKPPWAGGWKVVGEKHPGWSQWKADKAAARDAAKAERGIGRPSWAGPKPSPEAGG